MYDSKFTVYEFTVSKLMELKTTRLHEPLESKVREELEKCTSLSLRGSVAYLKENKISAKDFQVVLAALKTNSTVTSIKILTDSVNVISDLSKILIVNKNIKSLNIKFKNLNEKIANNFTQALSKNNSLDQLEIYVISYKKSTEQETLRTIEVIEDSVVKFLERRHIKSLRLSLGHKFKNAERLFEVLKKQPLLSELNLSRNKLGLEEIKFLEDLLTSSNYNIESLNLSHNNFGEGLFKKLAVALYKNTSINALYLKGNEYSPEEAEILLNYLKDRLAFLKIHLTKKMLPKNKIDQFNSISHINPLISLFFNRWEEIGSKNYDLNKLSKIYRQLLEVECANINIRDISNFIYLFIDNIQRANDYKEASGNENNKKFFSDFKDALKICRVLDLALSLVLPYETQSVIFKEVYMENNFSSLQKGYPEHSEILEKMKEENNLITTTLLGFPPISEALEKLMHKDEPFLIKAVEYPDENLRILQLIMVKEDLFISKSIKDPALSLQVLDSIKPAHKKAVTYLAENYLRLYGVCKEFTLNSGFTLPAEVTAHICSFLKPGDIKPGKFKQETEQVSNSLQLTIEAQQQQLATQANEIGRLREIIGIQQRLLNDKDYYINSLLSKLNSLQYTGLYPEDSYPQQMEIVGEGHLTIKRELPVSSSPLDPNNFKRRRMEEEKERTNEHNNDFGRL
ncbi:hypothetical protein H1Q59_03970 [Holosporaceae bacterium 'Namur']|nr:hypothetical protein [Holosporaceae bacterium 'Namur']